MSASLAKIHIAKKELGLDDDTYRAVLTRAVGTDTAKGLSEAKCGLVLEEFKRLGWKPRVVQGSRANSQNDASKPSSAAQFPSANKARALWISLWQLGAIRNKSEDALEAFACRQLKCEKFIWANQQEVYRLVEALKSMAERHGWPTKPNQTQIEIRQNLVIAQCQKLGRAAPAGLLNMDIGELQELSKGFGNQIQFGRPKPAQSEEN